MSIVVSGSEYASESVYRRPQEVDCDGQVIRWIRNQR